MSVHTVSGAHLTHTTPAPVRAAARTGVSVFPVPGLTTTVPKEFVHRASVAEVLLTDWAARGEDRFTVTAQWPRGHSFFTPVDGRHDPLLAAETLRQAALLLAHTEYGIPLGHSFLMRDLSMAFEPAQLAVGSAPAAIEVEATCTALERRRGAVTGFRIDVVLWREGEVAARGGGSFSAVAAPVYQRLRGGRGRSGVLALTAPTAPQTVGRTSPMDVVLSPLGRPDVWQLRVDVQHPVLFDHPVDHVPGMALLEAARQAASAHLARPCRLLAFTSEFDTYAELDAPCLIGIEPVASPAGATHETLLVTCRQEDRPVFSAEISVAGPAAQH
ncbi:ScbA/BarX family gamma-butyrolactone biosynthesis protein [Streptomyces sp. NPDC088785]|uniref:ScbA/BarX family gamma-butyrolactone biosynthesis protein n=1 Tax=Streptomyces sp. NPDC088785 TaxID=3365897 RepID=UPI0037FE7293